MGSKWRLWKSCRWCDIWQGVFREREGDKKNTRARCSECGTCSFSKTRFDSPFSVVIACFYAKERAPKSKAADGIIYAKIHCRHPAKFNNLTSICFNLSLKFTESEKAVHFGWIMSLIFTVYARVHIQCICKEGHPFGGCSVCDPKP